MSKVLKGQEGQGVIEYILLMVIVIGVVISLLAQFNRSIGDYIRSYYGDYISCLLETGELPTIGSTATVNGICDAQFQPFTFATGRPSNSTANRGGSSSGGGGSGGGNSSSPDGSGNTNSNNASNPTKNRNNNKASSGANEAGSVNRVFRSGGGGSGGGRSNLGSSVRSNLRPQSVALSQADEDGSRQPKGGVRTDSLTAVEGANAFGGRGSAGGRTQYVNLGKEDSNEGRTIARLKSVPASEEAVNSELRRVPLNEAKKSKAKNSDVDLSLSVGDYLRYLIIAILVITLLFFVGGQVRQVLKSLED